MAAVIRSVNVVSALRESPGTVGVTAIDKRPVTGPVPVRALGLYRDIQADRRHHGGEFQAVYGFAREEYVYWESVLGRPLADGSFGENLTVEGSVGRATSTGAGEWALDDLEIGAVVRIGTVTLQVTAPRTPCRVFADWVGRDGWVKEFARHGRTGVYFRVVVKGAVSAGDALEVVEAPGHGIGVARFFAGLDEGDAAVLSAWARDTGTPLHHEVAERIDRALVG